MAVSETPELRSRSDIFDTSGLPSRTGPTDQEEQWLPSLSDRQLEIFRSRARLLLVDGPRFSGKSILLSHKTISRAWEINEANIGIFVSSYKVATDGGVWIDLLDAAKEWALANITSERGHTFEITSQQSNGEPGSKVDAKNRTPYFTVRNQYGTDSIIRLFSIDNENEIERKVKGTRFQFIWIVELSNFERRDVVTLCEDQLRSKFNPFTNSYLPDEELQLVCDTNPANDGKKNWIYKWWYERDAGIVDEKYRAQVDRFTSQMSVEFLSLDDNPFLPQSKKDSLIGKYAGDPHNFQRFVLGEWPDGVADKAKLFADVFSEELIVPDSIDVDDLTEKLYCGYDLGPKNKAWVLLEKKIVEGFPVWCGLDELVYIDDYVSTEDFTLEVMERLILINDHYRGRRRNFKGFTFEHWSDSSSWTPNLNDEGGTEAVEVYNASNRQIELRPAEKPAKSVEVGVQIIRKLMRESRFFIGKNMPQLEKSLRNIKRATKGNKTIDPGDPLKHVVDALRYPIFMESVDDMMADPIQEKFKNQRTLHIAL